MPEMEEASGIEENSGTETNAKDVIKPEELNSIPDWEEVAKVYGGFLYTVAFRLSGNDYDAADLVQETLLRVRKGLVNYQSGSMKAWLSKIATNAYFDELRRRKRRPVAFFPDNPDKVIEPSPGAEEVLFAHRIPKDIQAALMKLPQEFRTAVILCDIAQLSYSEISQILAIPVGTVRSRIYRGRAMLRKALA